MAHTLARLIYRRLKFGRQYVDQGIEYYKNKTGSTDSSGLPNKQQPYACNSFLFQRLPGKFLKNGDDQPGMTLLPITEFSIQKLFSL